jgi:hypothetical protein
LVTLKLGWTAQSCDSFLDTTPVSWPTDTSACHSNRNFYSGDQENLTRYGCIHYLFFGGSATPFASPPPGPSIFSIYSFGSTTLLTGMTSISLHMQWPLTNSCIHTYLLNWLHKFFSVSSNTAQASAEATAIVAVVVTVEWNAATEDLRKRRNEETGSTPIA